MIIRDDLLLKFSLHVHTLCVYFNGSLLSWYRTEKHNHDVGGDPDSLHKLALAADITYDTPEDQARAIRYAERNGLFYVPKTNAAHFQPLPPKKKPDAS